MSAQEQVISNHVLLASILDQLTSQQLLAPRLVCKLWRDEANRRIRHRQQKFFFSPATKIRSTEGYNDLQWKRSWDNVLQISFIYSPKRDTFIRASHRFIDATLPSVHVKASPLDPGERRIESDVHQEIDDFHNGQEPRTSPIWNFHCKTAGYTLDDFTDFLEYLSDEHESRGLGENDAGGFLGDSNFPHLSFRFESGQLLDRCEISRFFRVVGPKIRYLTVGINHMCKETAGPQVGPLFGPQFGNQSNSRWDHGYEVFRMVPNLQVLTLVLHSLWYEKINQTTRLIIDPELNEPIAEVMSNEVKVEGEVTFGHLKCLRIQGRGDKSNEHLARWILTRAKNVERVVYEMGVSPCLLGEVNSDLTQVQNQGQQTFLALLPFPLRLIMPITSLWLRIFGESPQMMQHMAQVIDLQQKGQGQWIKTLHLYLTTPPSAVGDDNPYESTVVPPLLQILKAVSGSLETLTLAGGAGAFLEGLIQKSNFYANFDEKESTLQNFARVTTLNICIRGLQTEELDRTDFRWRPSSGYISGVTSSSSSTSTPAIATTTLSKIFPLLDELNLDYECRGRGIQESFMWMSFLPCPVLGFDLDSPRGVDEVKSVRKLHLAPSRLYTMLLGMWKFSNLDTFCLDIYSLGIVGSTIWTLTSLKTLMIDKMPAFGNHLEILLTGLTPDVIKEYGEDLDKGLAIIPEGDRSAFLADQRRAFRDRLASNRPSILDLNRLQHLKLSFELRVGWRQRGLKFSRVSELLLFDSLPPSCHITIWGIVYNPPPEPTEQQLPTILSAQPLPATLEAAVGPLVSNHERVSLRTIMQNQFSPERPF